MSQTDWSSGRRETSMKLEAASCSSRDAGHVHWNVGLFCPGGKVFRCNAFMISKWLCNHAANTAGANGFFLICSSGKQIISVMLRREIELFLPVVNGEEEKSLQSVSSTCCNEVLKPLCDSIKMSAEGLFHAQVTKNKHCMSSYILKIKSPKS